MKTQFKAALGAITLTLVGQVSAATTWTWSSNPTDVTPNAQTVSGVTATPTGWADTGSGTPAVIEQQNGTPNTSSGAVTTNFATYSGGLGINNMDGTCPTCSTGDAGDVYSSAPEHALDNNQRYEMVLLSFGPNTLVNLTSINLGWVDSTKDADFTVMAFQGDVTKASVSGLTWNSLDAGWKLVGNYNNSSSGDKTISTSYLSSYWLIGAYNPLAAKSTTYTNASGQAVAMDTSSDYFKLKSITGDACTIGAAGCGSTTTKVPEPGSLALLSLGVLGLVRMRRFRQD